MIRHVTNPLHRVIMKVRIITSRSLLAAGAQRLQYALPPFALLLGAALPLRPNTRDLGTAICDRQSWNMPIGTSAQYVAINMAGIPGNNVWAGMPQIDDDYIVFKPTAPLTAINYSDAAWTGRDRCPATGGLLVQCRCRRTLLYPVF